VSFQLLFGDGCQLQKWLLIRLQFAIMIGEDYAV
jgi:hypothetical protein